MRESEAALRQLIQERNEAEREKWTILRHARDEAERCLTVTTQLTARDAKIEQLQEELAQVKKKKKEKTIQFIGKSMTHRDVKRNPKFIAGNNRQVRMQLSRQQQQMANQRISPTIAITAPSSNQQQPRQSAATTARQKRSSVSSMDSAAVVSDACDEPLYSRIDHSSSNESQQATTAAMSSITAPNNHDGMICPLKAIQRSRPSTMFCPTFYGSAIQNVILATLHTPPFFKVSIHGDP